MKNGLVMARVVGVLCVTGMLAAGVARAQAPDAANPATHAHANGQDNAMIVIPGNGESAGQVTANAAGANMIVIEPGRASAMAQHSAQGMVQPVRMGAASARSAMPPLQTETAPAQWAVQPVQAETVPSAAQSYVRMGAASAQRIARAAAPVRTMRVAYSPATPGVSVMRGAATTNDAPGATVAAAMTPAAPAMIPAPVAADTLAPAATPVPGAAAGAQDPEAIRTLATDFLRQQTAGLPGKVGITVAPSFARGLAPCSDLTPFLPPGTRLWGRTTVGVRCTGAKPWTLYLQARIALSGTYYLAARTIAPGEVLAATDLVARDGDLAAMPQAIITDPSQAVGATATARITAGLPLRQDLLRAANAVQAGQSVKLVAEGPGFSISADGSALSNASAGQSVRVRTAGGQIISGIVRDDGAVEVRL